MPPTGKSAGSPRLEELPDEDDFCRQCGKALPVDNMYGWRKFCCAKCRMRWHYENSPEMFGSYAKMHGDRTCQSCGTMFAAGSAKQKFCGHACYWKSKRGKPFPNAAKSAAT